MQRGLAAEDPSLCSGTFLRVSGMISREPSENVVRIRDVATQNYLHEAPKSYAAYLFEQRFVGEISANIITINQLVFHVKVLDLGREYA